MFRSDLVVGALVAFFGAAALLGAVAAVRARGRPAKVDAAAGAVLALVMLAMALGWAPLATVPLMVTAGVVFLWFAVRLSIYRAVLTLFAGLVLFFASRGGASATDHPPHEVGTILVLVMCALLALFAAAGWLLATFATPKGDGAVKPVPRLYGVCQALMTAGVALSFYAIS
ncbi:MAG: hypothetical protein NVSMB43_23050 [Pseudarthrobacter sp.]